MSRKKILKVTVLKEVNSEEDEPGIDPFAKLAKKKKRRNSSSDMFVTVKLHQVTNEMRNASNLCTTVLARNSEVCFWNRQFSSDAGSPASRARARWKKGGKLAASGANKVKAAAKKAGKQVHHEYSDSDNLLTLSKAQEERERKVFWTEMEGEGARRGEIGKEEVFKEKIVKEEQKTRIQKTRVQKEIKKTCQN